MATAEEIMAMDFEQFTKHYVGFGEIPEYQLEFINSLTRNGIKNVSKCKIGELNFPAYKMKTYTNDIQGVKFNASLMWNEHGYYVSRNLIDERGLVHNTDLFGVWSKLSVS